MFRLCQLSIWDGTYFTVTLNDPANEIGHGTECFQVLQEADAKRCLARHAMPAQQATEWMLELLIISHGGEVCNKALNPSTSPIYSREVPTNGQTFAVS